MVTLCKSSKVKLRSCEVSRIVLRHDETGYQPFVVHVEVFPEDRPSFYVDGGYHAEMEPAVVEFGRRALRDLQRAIREQRQEDRLLADIENGAL